MDAKNSESDADVVIAMTENHENKPVEILSSDKPVEAPSSDKPDEFINSDKPVETLKSERPVEALNSDKPVETPSDQPVEGLDSDKPVEALDSDKTVETPSSDKPVEALNSNKPVETLNSDKPVGASNSDKLVETPSSDPTHLVTKSADVGSLSAKNMYFRADKIDFKSWDIQLEKHLSRVWSKDREAPTKKEEWEIDLAKLDLKSVIAHGTYGTVYKAIYDGQDVAVKVLDWGEDGMATAAETASLRASFRQEVAVWHKLDHPNVTKFVGASMGTSNLKIPTKSSSDGAHDSLPSRACCVVVEYLAGGTLKHYLIRNRRKKLVIKVVIQLALDLARGLSYLHSKKIVHRDVKTENMLLDTSRTLKIADFGVARVEAQNPRDMTGETGTLGYMAPEVLDGKPYNRKCDVYSFGICLWEIYCCDMPYPDLSFADVSSAVVRQNLRPDMPRCCPSSVASIMRKCWDANPDKRPEMDEVVRLLEAVDTSKGGGMIPDDQATQGCFCFGPTRGP